MRTLVALAVRDRAALVEPCLASISAALSGRAGFEVVAWLDPLDVETGLSWLEARGVPSVVLLDLGPELPPRRRVLRMRQDAARVAEREGFDRVLYLDSDVALSEGFVPEFERLWPELYRLQCGALSLGNYAGYEKHVVAQLPELRASIRRFGLGACLAFPTEHALAAADSSGAAWDTLFSRLAAGNRVLTSDASYVRHDGRSSGMCASRGIEGLDFQRLAPDLERVRSGEQGCR